LSACGIDLAGDLCDRRPLSQLSHHLVFLHLYQRRTAPELLAFRPGSPDSAVRALDEQITLKFRNRIDKGASNRGVTL
jgi:hypothetical protein